VKDKSLKIKNANLLTTYTHHFSLFAHLISILTSELAIKK